MKYIKYLILLVLINIKCLAQDDRSCLEEVLRYEDAHNYKKDTTLANKNIYMSYSMRVTDQESHTTVSNVKVFRNQDNVHFFSEQASMFNDSKEVLLILPAQKLVMLSSTDKRINNIKLSDQFFEMRKGFLDSCDIVKCENKDGNTKILQLKINPKKANPSVKIIDITYEYKIDTKKISSVKVNYNSEYKIKQIAIIYKDFDSDSKYSFSPVRAYYAKKNGRLLDKYSGYEFVDNRDSQKSIGYNKSK